jgi:hypothetical protein
LFPSLFSLVPFSLYFRACLAIRAACSTERAFLTRSSNSIKFYVPLKNKKNKTGEEDRRGSCVL